MNPILKLIHNLIEKGFEHFGRYYSSYRGFVVDSDDPESLNRLYLKVPQIYGDNTMKYWAWQKNNYSGKGYGSQCIPSIGDMVWVEFENGDPRKPIWSYGHFGENEKPDGLKDIKNYWFKTPGGNLIEVDDTNSLIRITNAQGKVVCIKDTINLGSEDAAEQMALGNTLVATLGDICDVINNISDTIQQITVNTPMGVSSPPTNALEFGVISAGINEIKSNLDTILSKVSKTD